MRTASTLPQLFIAIALLSSLVKPDPDPLQDYCIADTKAFKSLFINGVLCINPKLAEVSHFTTSALSSNQKNNRELKTLTNQTQNEAAYSLSSTKTKPNQLYQEIIDSQMHQAPKPQTTTQRLLKMAPITDQHWSTAAEVQQQASSQYPLPDQHQISPRIILLP